MNGRPRFATQEKYCSFFFRGAVAQRQGAAPWSPWPKGEACRNQRGDRRQGLSHCRKARRLVLLGLLADALASNGQIF